MFIYFRNGSRNCRCRPLIQAMCFALCLLPTTLTLAQDLDLQTAIHLTLHQHPDLRVFPLKQHRLQGTRQTAALRPAYEINVEIENFAGSDDFQAFDAAETTVALSSVVELGGQRQQRLMVVDALQKRLPVQQQVLALDIIAETTRRFVTLLAAQESHQLALQAEVLSQIALRSVQHRVNEGASPRAEAFRAEAALIQASLAVSQAANDIHIAKLRLMEMWAGTDTDFDSAGGDLFALSTPQPPEQFINRLQNNVHLQALASEEQLREAELRSVKSQGSTNVRWHLGIKQLQADDDTALVAGASVPLFGGRRNRGEVLQAESSLTEAKVQTQSARLQLQSRLLQLLEQHRIGHQQVNEYRTRVVPLLQQAQDEAESAYQRGLYSYIELVGAQQDLIHTQQQLIERAAKVLSIQADIEQLTAQPLALPDYNSDLPEVHQ